MEHFAMTRNYQHAEYVDSVNRKITELYPYHEMHWDYVNRSFTLGDTVAECVIGYIRTHRVQLENGE